jgi:uncharacterized protein YjiS (DUF1127 family)
MTMSILPTMAQAVASNPKKRVIRAKAVASPQVAQATVEPIQPAFARFLRLVDRAGQTRSAQAVNAYVTAVWRRFLAWQMRRATRLILNSLDDRTLADIGLRRGEINTLFRDIEQRKARWYLNP